MAAGSIISCRVCASKEDGKGARASAVTSVVLCFLLLQCIDAVVDQTVAISSRADTSSLVVLLLALSFFRLLSAPVHATHTNLHLDLVEGPRSPLQGLTQGYADVAASAAAGRRKHPGLLTASLLRRSLDILEIHISSPGASVCVDTPTDQTGKKSEGAFHIGFEMKA